MTREQEVECPEVTLSDRGSGYESRSIKPEEQVKLIRKIKSSYNKRVLLESKDGNMTPEDKRNLPLYLQREKIASEILILGSFGLVGKVLKEFPSADENKKILQYKDLFQEGLIGLMKAVSLIGPSFDPERSEYSTFVYPYIKNAVIRAIQEKGGSAIRYPIWFQEMIRAYDKAIAIHGVHTSREDLSKILHITLRVLDSFLEQKKKTVTTINFSLLESIEENESNGEEAVGRKLYSKKSKRGYFDSRTAEKIALRKIVLDQVESRILSQFTTEQRLMFSDWKGLLGFLPPEETNDAISKRTGKTRWTVIKLKSLAKLKAKLILEEFSKEF